MTLECEFEECLHFDACSCKGGIYSCKHRPKGSIRDTERSPKASTIPVPPKPKQKKGLACLPKERRIEIARMGGKCAKGHKWSPEEAIRMASKGGKKAAANRRARLETPSVPPPPSEDEDSSPCTKCGEIKYGCFSEFCMKPFSTTFPPPSRIPVGVF